MVTRACEMPQEQRENMRGGNGKATLSMLAEQQKLPPNIRLASVLSFPKGCSVGLHPHEGECEIYYILEGEAKVYDNGETKMLGAGDTLITYSGETHNIENIGEQELKFMAFIVAG